jgi:hypothetical protein
MNGFTLFRRGECPICSGAAKGCRQSNTTGLIFCRDTGANPPGYVYRGQDIWGFGLWQAKADADAFSRQATEEREQRRREYLAAQERQRQQQIARQLSAADRDRGYRQLLNHLTLTDGDRQKLLGRGFTSEQIINDNYKSVRAWQKVGQGLPLNLPGILPNGALNVAGNGILCPIYDKDGLIVGCQVRLHDCQNGRYRWLTSSTKKNPDGAIPHLNGELPIGIFEPLEFTGDSIWLTEGTSIKPSLTRYRLGVPVVGAASGRFNGSTETARVSVEYLSTKYQTKILTFAIDAGDVINISGVPERWQQQFEFFQELGYECRVAWWGQVSKQHDDIDELTETSIIQRITPLEFWEIVQNYRNNGTPEPTKEEPIQEENENLDWAWNNWLKSRRFTPDIALNQEKFRFKNIPDSNAIIAAKSGLGTGKTEAMLELIQASNRGVMLIGYRNNLLFQTIDRGSQIGVKIYHLREEDGQVLVADENTHQAFCLDSIHHVDGYFAGRDIYLDESCSVLLHAINGGTLGENQAKVIRIFTHALNICNRIFLLDGNLADIYADFVAKIVPNKRLIKIGNQRKIPPHSIKFIEGVDLEGEIRKRDKSALISALCSSEVVPWIATDSKELSKVLDKILRDFGKTGYVFNSETAAESWAKEFLADPNQYIQDKNPQYIIISPTAESGVSVTINDYFTDKFSFFSGVLGTNSQHQLMFRLRDHEIPHYVFCPKISMVQDRANPNTYSLKAFKEILEDRILQSAVLAAQDSGNSERVLEVIGNAISKNNNDWWEFSCKLGVLDKFEMNNLRQCLIHALKEAGHNFEVIRWDIDKAFQDKEKETKELIKKEHAQELFTSVEYPSLEEAKQASKTNQDKMTQRRIEKTYLLERIPGIKDTELWNADFIYEYYIKDKEFITKQQRYWLLNNFEVSQKRHEVDWYYKATGEDFFNASMRRISHLTIWALKELNILQFLKGEWHKDMPEVISLIEKARQPEIALALGEKPNAPRIDGKERIEFISKLLAMVGCKFKKQGQKLFNGVRQRVYAVDIEFMENPARLAVLAAVERKFTSWMAEKSQIDWSEQELEQAAEESPPTIATSPAETAAAKLRQVTDWSEIGLSQEELNSAWELLEPEHQTRLRQLHEQFLAGSQNEAIADAGSTQVCGWKGLKLQLQQGLENAGNLYQELISAVGNAIGVAEEEPIWNEYFNQWIIKINFANDFKSVFCDWLISVKQE